MNPSVPEFRAVVEWASPNGSSREIASGSRLVHPGRFPEDGNVWPVRDGWSVILTFEHPVAYGDARSNARARFLMPNAPHDRMKPGGSFDFFEGITLLARVRVGERLESLEADV